MRIFAISDIHVDYEGNRRWINSISAFDYKNDLLIVAGDISGDINLIEQSFVMLKKCFNTVLFINGNHDIWVRDGIFESSFEKFKKLELLACKYNIHMEPYNYKSLTIVPLNGWYDYSFGEPAADIAGVWADYYNCKWPKNYDVQEVSEYFLSLNKVDVDYGHNDIISFSHFVPRFELIPKCIPFCYQLYTPVLGSKAIGKQVVKLRSKIHVYGHSHINGRALIDGTLYLNNAFGYPHEKFIAKKELLFICEV
jgi:Icc-related predicted phosphoesterase